MNSLCISAGALVVMAGAAGAGPIEVIYTKITGHPTAIVPGALTPAGDPETIEFRDLRDIALSPDGTQWMLRASTQNGALTGAGPDHNDICMKGSGRTGAMFVQEGQPMPAGTGQWVDFMPSGFGKFNANNELVLSVRARTAQALTASGGSTNPSDGQRIFRWSSGSGFSLALKQGQTYAGSANTVGNSISSFHLLNDGRVGSDDTTVNGSSTINILSYTDATMMINVFKQKGVHTVLDLDGVTVLTWGGFTSLNPTEFYTTPDGAHWFVKGTIQGAATTEDTVFAYDGQVRLREGRAIAGSSPTFTVGDIFQYFAAGSHWIARGRDNSSTAATAPDFVVVDGVLVARTGDLITPGSTEHWGDTFQAITINAAGDWAVAAATDNPDTTRNDVIVMNGQTVIIRKGDMVDLNNNGVADDDAFIGRASGVSFDPNDVHITTGRMVYFIGYLHNGAGTDLGITPTAFLGPQAFLRIQAPAACAADFNGVGGLNVQDIFDFLAAWFAGDPRANFNGTGGITVADIFDFLGAWFAGC
jgi:hypothetical protein